MPMQLNRFVFLFLLYFGINYAVAQDSLRHSKQLKVYPLPALGYAPETRWYIGAVALFNLRLVDDSISRPNTFKTEFNITQNKQWVTYLNFTLRPQKEKFIIEGSNGYYKFPEDYWGIGANTPDENKVNYDARRLELDNSFLIRSGRQLYSGIRYRYHNMVVENYNPELNIPSATNERYETGAVGGALLFDSRDNTFNSTSGYYLYASGLFFEPFFGGTYSFQKIDVDARTYFPVHNNGVIAFQVNSSFNIGNAPFRMIPLFGNESSMRGYYTGRYRDDFLVTTQVEYRTSVWRWVGIAAFAGGGSVFNSNTTNFEDTLLPNYGLGLRIRVDKKDNINLRFDYGLGKNSDGFYVAFAEAF